MKMNGNPKPINALAFTQLLHERANTARHPPLLSLFRMVIHLNSTHVDLDEVSSARARALGELATGFYPSLTWQKVVPQMASDWNRVRGNSALGWNDVREEAHAAWQVAKLSKDACCRDDQPVTMSNVA